eukprot:m.62399 g.62399  ORF g.62399 m.62399 type:complete len:422 (+) comp13339_c0_seq2:102-1367(+)
MSLAGARKLVQQINTLTAAAAVVSRVSSLASPCLPRASCRWLGTIKTTTPRHEAHRCLSSSASSAATMKAAIPAPIDKNNKDDGDADRQPLFRFEHVPVPACKPTDVLIKVHAAGINRPDVLQRKGLYPPPKGHSTVLGLEVSGEVVAVGSEAGGRWGVGDRVCALANGGAYAEYVAVPYGQCLPIPAPLTMTEAACVPETFFTVWHNVFEQSTMLGRRVGSGDAVLIHGGSSGIGTTAIQLCHHFGMTVCTTVGSDKKADRCKALGADLVVNYREQTDFAGEVGSFLKDTHGGHVNLVLDMIGAKYAHDNLRLLAPDGRIAVIGALGGYRAEIDLLLMMQRRLTLAGCMLRAQGDNAKQKIADALEAQVWPLLEAGSVAPVMDTVYPFEKLDDAHRHMEASTHIGKLAVTILEGGTESKG